MKRAGVFYQLVYHFVRRYRRFKLVISGFEPFPVRKEAQPDPRRPLTFEDAFFVKPGHDRRRAGAGVYRDGLLRGVMPIRIIDLIPQPHRAAYHGNEDQ